MKVKRFILYGIPKSLLFKIIIALVILLFGKNVFAQTTDVSSKIRYSPDTSGGTYHGDEIYLGGYNGQFSVKTRYNGQLSQIEFYLKDSDYSFDLNKTYTITLNMETSDWRNNFMGPLVYAANSDGTITSGSPNWYVSNTFSFVSMKKIKFNIKPTGTIKPLTKFTIYSTNINTTAITGVNNWNLYSIIIDDNSSSGGSSGTTPTPTPTPNPTFDDSGIINNANENTQDIINNSDKNTSDIIENNNHNADIINESINAQCKNGLLVLSDDYYMKDNYYLDENGNEVSDDSAAISIYFVIKPNSLYTISSPGGLAGNDYSICLYDSNKNLLAANSSRKCTSVNQYTNGVNSGPYAQYMRITIPKRWYATLGITGPICNNFTKESIDNASSAIGGAIQGGASGIIDNANENTQSTNETIENQFQKCRDSYNLWGGFVFSKTSSGINFTYNKNGSITASGTANGTALSMISGEAINYYKTLSSGTYTISGGVNVNQRVQVLDSSGNEIASSGSTSSSFTLSETKQIWIRIRIASGQSVNTTFNIQLQSGNVSTSFEPYGEKFCSNRLDEQTNAINDVNDSINNPNVDSGTGSDFFNNFSTEDNGGISGIITKPLVLINSLLSNNSSCNNLTFGVKFPTEENKNVSFPSGCILWDNVPNNVVNIYQIFVVGFCSYYLLRRLFKDVEDLKNPEKDNVEVIDL